MQDSCNDSGENMMIRLPGNHESWIIYNKEGEFLAYELLLGNSNIEFPKLKGMKFNWQNDKLVITSKLRFITEFGMFTDEVYSLIKNLSINELDEIIQIIKERVRVWKEFIGKPLGQGLSIEKEIGLYGELNTLELLIENEGPNVINYWTGPLYDHKDFRLPSLDIETKTIGYNNNSLIHINGAQQLHSDKELFLHVHFIQEDEDGLELSELIDNIIECLEGEIREQFISKLSSVGYSPQITHRSNKKFLVLDSWFYEVNDMFPRQPVILNNKNLQYDIPIESIRTFIVPNYR